MPEKPRPHSRALLCQQCSQTPTHCQCLFDIRDPSAFVQGTINAFTSPTARRPWPITLSADEREDLHQEGLAILYRLAAKYEPQREGYAQEGRFSGYAAMFLPRKLGDAWHRMHPSSHHQVQNPVTGKREWKYDDRSVSLEALTAEDPDRHAALGTRDRDGDIEARLYRALLKRGRSEYESVVSVTRLVARQLQPREIAGQLGLDPKTVARHLATQKRALPHPRHQWVSTSQIRQHLELQVEADACRGAQVGRLLSQGSTKSDVAKVLGITERDVEEHMNAIKPVIHAIEEGQR